MICKTLVFSDHAIDQMFKRAISVGDVKHVIETGEVIREYLDDKPYPSYLMLGLANFKNLHIVVASDEGLAKCIVVTAYEATTDVWESDFRTKNKKL